MNHTHLAAHATTRSAGTARRRTVLGVVLGLVAPMLLGSAAVARHVPRRNGDQAPVPPKCAKLGGKCVVNGDCCGAGTRCKRVGRNQCRCKAHRAKCGPVCCPAGLACYEQCADLHTDANNCGACFTACGVDQTCESGNCSI